MKDKIYIDHCYSIDQNFKYLLKLEKLGFTIDKKTVEHPGKAFCRFILLPSENSRKRFYLEFVSIGKGGTKFETPGLSLGFSDKLSIYNKKISKKFDTKFWHKNYHWKKNNEDYLPGWNFLDFKKPIIQNINTWFTEYEDMDERNWHNLKKHKNAVNGLHGIVLTLTKKSKANFELVLGKKIKDKVLLSAGIYLYVQDGKKDKFETIILNTPNLIKTKEFIGRSGKMTNYQEQDMILINPPNHLKSLNWNILIRENI